MQALAPTKLLYARLVPKEAFYERLTRLLDAAKIGDAEAASILGVSQDQVRRLKKGTTQTMKLAGALRLARRLGVTPGYLADVADPGSDLSLNLPDGTVLSIDVKAAKASESFDHAAVLTALTRQLSNLGLVQQSPVAEYPDRVNERSARVEPSSGTEELSPEQQRTLLALGGQALVDELRAVRRRLEDLEAFRDSFSAPSEKRAAQ